MAFLSLDHKHRVLYSCTCSQLAPLGELYFCRHCTVQRCQDCVSTVIDGFSCPHCFESSPLTEAKNRKNRCNHCFQCPQCASTLTTRSVIVPSEVLGDQSPQKRERGQSMPQVVGTSPVASSRSSLSGSSTKSPGGTKVYFLCCTHCKWSTRDVSIRDKRSPIDFKDRPSPYQERVAELTAYYKEFALRDKAEREKTKKTGRRAKSYGGLLDPSKFTSGKVVGPESPSPPRRAGAQITWDASLPERMAAKATTTPSPPPDNLYTTSVKLDETTSLMQRFLDPTFQPTDSTKFWPRPLHVIGKKLHRCKGCDHILLKAEMNPSSIRFKIQQIALHTFPNVRIWEYPTLEAGKPCELLLSVTNPVNYQVTISFEQYSTGGSVKSGTVLPVSLPEGEYTLTPNDDVVDILEDIDAELEDDPKFIHSRPPGKLVLKFTITPESVGEDCKFMFLINFTHKSAVESDKSSGLDRVQVPILVHAGRHLSK